MRLLELVGGTDLLAWVAVKAVLMFAVAVIGLRLGERRTLAQLGAFDFAVAVAIGAIISRTVTAASASFPPAQSPWSGNRHQAASCRYSVTWMKSITMVTVMPGGGLRLDLPDLVLVAVGQRDPGPLMVRVAAAGLGEGGGYHVGGISGHARGQPLAGGPGGRRAGTGPRTASAVRGTGARSKTAPASAIRSRLTCHQDSGAVRRHHCRRP